MNYTLENFIDQYDEFSIVEEGSKNIGTDAWNSVQSTMDKSSKWFGKLLLNINYFKNAMLPEQMSKDMLKLLQASQARTESIFEMLPKTYKELASRGHRTPDSNTKIDGKHFGLIGDNKETSRMTTLNDQAHRISSDVMTNVHAAKRIAEYKRFMKNEYTDNSKPIPLANIIPDMQKCQSNLQKFEGHVNKLKSYSSKVEGNPDAQKVLQNVMTCMQHITRITTSESVFCRNILNMQKHLY